jgi:hypothetical protein
MMIIKILRPLSALLLTLSALVISATAQNVDKGLVRDATRTIDLSHFVGKPYLVTILDPNGIYAATQKDDITPVVIAKPTTITAAVATFDPSLAANLYGEFLGGESDFTAIIGHIQGKSLSPRQIRSTLLPFITHLKSPARANLALDRSYEAALLASSSGVLVQIDANNAFYNVAYQSPIVQSGRSYGVAPGRKLLDQSDRAYLRELDAYLKTAKSTDAVKLDSIILELLAKSTSSGLAALPNSGQVAATDFLTIYTAELIRHNMVNLDMSKDPWEVDLGEVTLLANYCAPAGMVMVNGKLISGSTSVYGTSAIGEHRKDFTALARQIEAFERSTHPNLISAVEKLTPIPDQATANSVSGDVFRRLLVYVNLPGTQMGLQQNATRLVSAMTDLLKHVRIDSSQITSSIQTKAIRGHADVQRANGPPGS